LVDKLALEDIAHGDHLVQALDENGEYYHVVGLEHLEFHDSDGTSKVAVIRIRAMRR